MKQIKCTLPNASTRINGVEFEPVEDGVLSGPVDDAVAEQFARIPGYTVDDVEVSRPKSAAKAPAKSPATLPVDTQE